MKCGILYFSATGNTSYVASLFKKELSKYNVGCEIIEIDKCKNFKDDFDIFILGSPIHCETYPNYFVDYIMSHLKVGKGRKVLIYSTQAAEAGVGPNILGDKLSKIGFRIYGQICFRMPNNYYLTFFPPTPEKVAKSYIHETTLRIEGVVKNFLEGKRTTYSAKKINIALAKVTYPLFASYSFKWAKKKLEVDDSLCTRCKKCVINCPTNNIKIVDNNIYFNNNCISCVRCLHNCPFNAFLYKGKHFIQYKLETLLDK